MTKRTCAVCPRSYYARGYCSMHYARWRKTGDPFGLLKRPPPKPRSDLRVFRTCFIVADNGCWEWKRPLDTHGYGRFTLKGQRMQAHRASYLLFIGTIADGMELDHLCRNPCCVNPFHVQPVSHAENMARAAHQMKTHCVHGHRYTSETAKVRGKYGRSRFCLICRRTSQRRYEQKRLAAKRAAR